MNIGILGGSFDPIHNGHLHMAKCAYESYALDQVWLIPAGHSPNKDEHGMTDAKDRFQMCKLAAQPYPWMTVSRLELDSAERSYTYRTMEKLSEQFPMHHFFFIMGGDSLDYFEQWKQPERIAKLATILVIPRDLFTIAALEKKIRLLQEQFPCDIRIVPCERFFDVFHKDPPGTDERRISGTCVSGRSICVYSQASSVSIVKKWSKTYGTRRNTKEIEKRTG